MEYYAIMALWIYTIAYFCRCIWQEASEIRKIQKKTLKIK